MSKRSQVHLSSLALAASIVLVACFLLLIFYVPRLAYVWDEQDRDLLGWERTLVYTYQSAQPLSLPIFALVASLFVAAFIWRVVSQIEMSREERLTSDCS